MSWRFKIITGFIVILFSIILYEYKCCSVEYKLLYSIDDVYYSENKVLLINNQNEFYAKYGIANYNVNLDRNSILILQGYKLDDVMRLKKNSLLPMFSNFIKVAVSSEDKTNIYIINDKVYFDERYNRNYYVNKE